MSCLCLFSFQSFANNFENFKKCTRRDKIQISERTTVHRMHVVLKIEVLAEKGDKIVLSFVLLSVDNFQKK